MVVVLHVGLAVLLALTVEARLVFPPGSDLGYIVPDDSLYDQMEDDRPSLQDLEDDSLSNAVLGRVARETIDGLESALLRTIDARARNTRQKMLQVDPDEIKVQPTENWHGQWFPHKPKLRVQPPADLPDSLKDDKHGVAMGIKSVKCDNAKVNLTVDWDYSSINYTCYDPKHHRLPIQSHLKSVEKCDDIPRGYSPKHICMTSKIEYNSTLPTYGNHRPIWPVYGEYKFVPIQRWLHSIEHGAVVMLYDPCTEPVVVNHLRKVLTGCYRKHIITPYTLLTKERPLALVAWGCSLEMAWVDEEEVRNFIKARALHGPEGHYPKDGGYKELLLVKGEYPPGAERDRDICPSAPA